MSDVVKRFSVEGMCLSQLMENVRKPFSKDDRRGEESMQPYYIFIKAPFEQITR